MRHHGAGFARNFNRRVLPAADVEVPAEAVAEVAVVVVAEAAVAAEINRTTNCTSY